MSSPFFILEGVPHTLFFFLVAAFLHHLRGGGRGILPAHHQIPGPRVRDDGAVRVGRPAPHHPQGVQERQEAGGQEAKEARRLPL